MNLSKIRKQNFPVISHDRYFACKNTVNVVEDQSRLYARTVQEAYDRWIQKQTNQRVIDQIDHDRRKRGYSDG